MKITENPIRILLTITALLLLPNGCINLEPQADLTKFYILQASEETAKSDNAFHALKENAAVFLGLPIIPEYLNDMRISSQFGENQIRFSEFDRWAEPLPNGIQRVMAENLSQKFGTDQILWTTTGYSQEATHQVEITIIKFGETEGIQVDLNVAWSISDLEKEEIVHSHKANYSIPLHTGSVSEVVSAMSQALTDLTEDIGKELADQ